MSRPTAPTPCRPLDCADDLRMKITAALLHLHASLAFQPTPPRSRCSAPMRCPPPMAAADAAPPRVAAASDPLSLLAAARFLADEMGDELPLKTGPGRVALFLASLTSPGSLPNPFATTRFSPRVFSARDADGKTIGVVQTALANIEPTEDNGRRGALRTVRFFQNVVVASNWRRKGVATALLRFAEADDSRYAAALAVEPQNEAAVELYRRLGFELLPAEPEREGMRLMMKQA